MWETQSGEWEIEQFESETAANFAAEKRDLTKEHYICRVEDLAVMLRKHFND
jgi:hypothetical protein